MKESCAIEVQLGLGLQGVTPEALPLKLEPFNALRAEWTRALLAWRDGSVPALQGEMECFCLKTLRDFEGA